MNSLILLAVICFVYYQVYKRYQLEMPEKYNIYFGVFVGCYLLLYYLMEFQKPFIYKIFSSVHNVDRPMYDIQTQSYSNSMNNQYVLKNNLALRQGFRCIGCQNPILQQDVDKHQLQYFKPLDYGGQPTMDNICLKCPSCSAFSQY
jgi:hypothetical protein